MLLRFCKDLSDIITFPLSIFLVYHINIVNNLTIPLKILIFFFPFFFGTCAASTVTDNYFGKQAIAELCNYCSEGLHHGRKIDSSTGIEAIRSITILLVLVLHGFDSFNHRVNNAFIYIYTMIW